MKYLSFYIGFIFFSTSLFLNFTFKDSTIQPANNSYILKSTFASDTCIIEGLTFKMLDNKSTKKLKAYIKNSQIYVESKGLQYAKYRITYYIFSSVDDENMPVVRHFDQRLSPPILKILKTAGVGNQYLIEEITVIDPSNKELTNSVRPILLERIKN